MWFILIRAALMSGILCLCSALSVCSQNAMEQLSYAEKLSHEYPDSAFLLLKETHDKAIDHKNFVIAASCLQQMGQVCYHLGHYAQSLDYHLQASDLFGKEKKAELLAGNLNDIGTLYYYNKQLPMARVQFDKALAIYLQFANNNGMAATYGKIGHLYEKQQRYDSAYYFQQKALTQYKVTGYEPGMAEIYEHLGSICEDLEKYDSASICFQQALVLYERLNDVVSAIEVQNNLGDILRKTGKYAESIVQSRKAAAAAGALNEHYQLSAAYRDIAKAWNLLKRDDSSFYYLELSRKYLLEIYSRENNKQVAFLQVMNDTEKKNAEIEKLKLDHRNTVILTGAGILVILLLVALGMLVISRQRLKIRNEQTLREQNRQVYEAQNELMQADLVNKQLQEENLKYDLELKAKELSTHTLHIIQKNQLLEELRGKLETMVKEDKRDQKKQLQQLIQQINFSFNNDHYWEDFRHIFEQVHESFFDRLKQCADDLTANDLRLIALLKMNLNSADISTLLGISPDSLRVTRYRLRKKLNLQQGENLSAFIQHL